MAIFYRPKYLAGQLHLSVDFLESYCLFARNKVGKYDYTRVVEWLNSPEGREIRKNYFFRYKACKNNLKEYTHIWHNCKVTFNEWVGVTHIKGSPKTIEGCEVRHKGNDLLDIILISGEKISKKKNNLIVECEGRFVLDDID